MIPTTSFGDQVTDLEEIVKEQTKIIEGKNHQIDLHKSQNIYLKSALDSTFSIIKEDQAADNAWYNDKFLYLFIGAAAGAMVMRGSR